MSSRGDEQWVLLAAGSSSWESYSYQMSSRGDEQWVLLAAGSNGWENYRHQISSRSGKQWVLLAAGSNGWENYRHQANVCHAYQVVHSNGIPDEQVVVMMYDDIAYNKENPRRGEIINEPDGRNVYAGVQKDYTGEDVTAHNFLAVLRGDRAAVIKQAGGRRKVLRSDENDTIFVFLSDHGNAGIFSFPNDSLYAFDLIDTINEMVRRRQFSKMVIYMECCLSGSMIEHLPKNAPVYGVSASTPHENHYACFYDPERLTPLSGEFTSWWLHHNKKSDLTRTTFQAQFKFLEKKMAGSSPCQYGNPALSQLSISEFLGSPGAETQRTYAHRARNFRVTDLIPSPDVPLKIQADRIQRERNPERRRALQQGYDKLLKRRGRIQKAVRDIALRASPDNGHRALTDQQSLTVSRLRDVKDVAVHYRQIFRERHGDQHHHIVLSHMQVFVNLCEYGVDVHSIKWAITSS